MLWQVKNINPEKAKYFAGELKLPVKFGEFLVARGFENLEEIEIFAQAKLQDILSPLAFENMEIAIARLIKARHNNEEIIIWGDYDADGLTATALLKGSLKALGHNKVTAFIPHRLEDGYGFKTEVFKKVIKKTTNLIITVDCGISDYETIEEASKMGIDVIITDHHRLPPKLPKAVAIINPHLNKAPYNEPLAGVGVAFMLAAALKRAYTNLGLIKENEGPKLVESLSLVAIGTIADLVPLTGTNRYLVKHGLHFLLNSENCGLKALKKISGLSNNQINISARDIGFKLAPKLNAAGRMGTASPALNVLTSQKNENAEILASELEKINNERYKEQQKLTIDALEKLEAEISPESSSVILASENWSRGLVGLAASKIAEKTQKPTILLSLKNGMAVGSGRSVGNFNLYNALNSLRHLFVHFGGHAQAAGLSITEEKLDIFQKDFEEITKNTNESFKEEILKIDLEVELSQLDILAKPLLAMEPFGNGNPNPIVILKNIKVLNVEPTKSGGDKHLRLTLSDGLRRQNIFAFNFGHRLFEIGPLIDAVLSLEFTEWNKQIQASWHLIDFKTIGKL